MIRTSEINDFIGKSVLHVASGILYTISSIEKAGDWITVVTSNNSNIVWSTSSDYAPFKCA